MRRTSKAASQRARRQEVLISYGRILDLLDKSSILQADLSCRKAAVWRIVCVKS